MWYQQFQQIYGQIKSDLKDHQHALAINWIRSWSQTQTVHMQSRYYIPKITTAKTKTKKKPLWEDVLNKGIIWAYHFSTGLVSMQKERHQRKTQLHMQTCTHTCRSKNKKAMLDRMPSALQYVFMNPKWSSLHLHDFTSTNEHNARLTQQCITPSEITSEITINKLLQLKGKICNDYTCRFIAYTGRATFTKISLTKLLCLISNWDVLTFFMSLLFVGSSDILWFCSSIISLSS